AGVGKADERKPPRVPVVQGRTKVSLLLAKRIRGEIKRGGWRRFVMLEGPRLSACASTGTRLPSSIEEGNTGARAQAGVVVDVIPALRFEDPTRFRTSPARSRWPLPALGRELPRQIARQNGTN